MPTAALLIEGRNLRGKKSSSRHISVQGAPLAKDLNFHAMAHAVSPNVKNRRPSGNRTTDVMSPTPKFALRLSATDWKSRAGATATLNFDFVQPLGSDEFIGEVDGALKFLNGVEGVGGNATTAKVTYWPAEVTEDAIRKQFADSGFAVK